MEFKNGTKSKIKVFTDEGDNVWKTISPGDTVNIPESYGNSLGMTPVQVKATTGKVGTKTVETKQVSAPRKRKRKRK